MDEDLSTIKIQTCREFDDPSEDIVSKDFLRTPAHHRNSWHLDKLIIAPSCEPGKSYRKLPEIMHCYRDSDGAYECQVHKKGDEDSACWLLHPSYVYNHFYEDFEGLDQKYMRSYLYKQTKKEQQMKTGIFGHRDMPALYKKMGTPGKPWAPTPVTTLLEDEEEEEEEEESGEE